MTTLNQAPIAKAEMLIRKPVEEVFEAFINPAITSKFWFTKGSGRLEAGKRVQWEWEMYGAQADVDVLEIEENKRILIDFGTKVEWIFTPQGENETFVAITNSGFEGDADEVVQQLTDSTEGFTIVLCGLKAYLEHGIVLNLVADKSPHAQRKMKNSIQKITTNLWFDTQAEEAAQFYTSIFKNSKIGRITRYGDGRVMTVEFQLEGQDYVALNGGPQYKFTEAVSFIVHCEDQEELDYYWEKLSEGGDEKAQVCGWLKDQYGVSWQIIPATLTDMISSPDPTRSERVMKALLQTKSKIDINTLLQAYEG